MRNVCAHNASSWPARTKPAQVRAVGEKDAYKAHGLHAVESVVRMTESLALKCTRKLRCIDNALVNANDYVFEHYYIMLRADPILAACLEQLFHQIDDARRQVHDIYVAAWERDHHCFDTIGQTGQLIMEARNDVLEKSRTCPAYSNVLDRSADLSSQLLERRVEAYSKQST